jgi:Uri superfamily endonuclease
MGDTPTTRGTYTLVVDLPEPTTIDVGALGSVTFPAGGYAYTGSAFGSGGLSRVDRHRRVAAGDHEVRHWHIDYLLGQPSTSIVEVVVTRAADVECAVASTLETGPVDGFGASDCTCETHLAHHTSTDELEAAVRRAHRGVRGVR